MKNNRSNWLPIFLLAFLCLLIEAVLFAPVIRHLNHAFFTSGGDGIKNIYNYLFYLKWNTGTHFTGMNYPFGEDVIFTDNTPLLAWIIKGMSHFYPDVTKYGLSILNISLLVSIPLGAIYLFKIQKEFGVSNIWALIASVIIIFFAPQIFNLSGFFGMAYLVYLPLLIYLLIKYHQKRKIITAFYIFLLTTCFSFLHVYNLAFTAVLIGFYVMAHLVVIRHQTIKGTIKKIFPLLIAVGLSVLTFFGYLKLFDPVTDRTSYPYGVFDGRTKLGDLFTSRLSPLGFIFQFLFGRAKDHEEGYAYIGLISIIVVLILIGYVITAIVILLKNKEKIPVHPVRAYRIWLLIAFFELLLSMGIPFKYTPVFWADHISLLRQFRTIGRFSWCFYYLFLIFCSIFIYRIYRWLIFKKRTKIARAMLTVVLIIWCIQLGGYFQWIRNTIVISAKTAYADFLSTNQLSIANWLHKKGTSPSEFQCIMGLPYFHIGSEKLWLQDNDNGRTMYHCARLSLKTGLPMADVQMSRTSWKQTFASVQLIDGPYSKKPLLKDSFSSKPILVMVNKHFPLKLKEREWIRNSTFIGTYIDFDFYSVTPKTIIDNAKQLRDSISKIALQSHKKEGIIGKDTSGFFWVNHFDKNVIPNTFSGTGAFNPHKRLKEQLVTTIPIKLKDTSDCNYFFSIWSYCNHSDYRTPVFIIRQYGKGGSLIRESYAATKYSTHVINNWYLVQKNVKFKEGIKELRIYVSGKRDYIALDELAIWPTNSVYFYKSPNGKLFLNNRPQ